MERSDESVRELVRKVRCMHETYRKMQRKIINEPESEAKYEKLTYMKQTGSISFEVHEHIGFCEKETDGEED